ncbi:MAG: c-type cytochrome biogenesis protein CcsB [Vampirovibrio sp.]|nr:c-type cytochrome biogenesis protein CcsB [Vampirovibrio sp.]
MTIYSVFSFMNEMQWVHTGMVLLILSLFFNVARVLTKNSLIREAGWGFMALSMISLIISLVLRSEAAEYFALSNMYESMLVLILWMQLAYLVLERWLNLPGFAWPVCLMLLVMLAYDITLPTDINPLQAALQSYWRSIHVPVIILSYALFTLAFVSSVVYLVKDRFHKNNEMDGSGGGGGLRPALPDGLDGALYSHETPYLAVEDSQVRDIYDELTYRCVSLGFPLLLIGIILGGLWANEAWGNYWSWDPKESMSLVTLLGYGVYLHLRVNGEHPPKTLAWVSVIGFILLLVTYFGVNIMGVGLHSYGKIG